LRRREEICAPEQRDDTKRERERGEIDEKGRDGKRRREMRRMWMEKKMKVKDLFCICA
jgi:hypothetical protein